MVNGKQSAYVYFDRFIFFFQFSHPVLLRRTNKILGGYTAAEAFVQSLSQRSYFSHENSKDQEVILYHFTSLSGGKREESPFCRKGFLCGQINVAGGVAG